MMNSKNILNYFTIKNIGLNNVALFAILGLMAFFSGNVIVANRGEIRIGFIFRFAVCTAPFILLISLSHAGNLLDFLNFRIRDIRLTHIVLSTIAALLTYPIVIYLISMPYSVAFFLCIIIFIAFLIALYQTIRGKVFRGIIIYILTAPFITFLLWELKYTTEMLTIGVFNFHPSAVFMLSLFLIWFIGGTFKREPLIKHPALIFFLLFICWGGVSVIFSQDISKSLAVWISVYFVPALLFILLINNVRTQKQILILLCLLIFLSVCTAFFEFYFTFGAEKKLDVEVLHATSLFWVGRGALILLAIPLNICLISSVSKKARMPALLSLIFLIILLILDNTRICILAFLISIIVFLIRPRYRIAIMIMALIAFIFWGYGVNLIFERFKDLEFTAQGLSMNTWSPMRVEGISAAIGMIKDFPLFGIGPGMWEEYFYRYGAPIFYGNEAIYIASAHNGYLDCAAQIGLPGLILWLSSLFLTFKACIKIIKNSKPIFNRNVALGCLGCLISLCVGSFGGYFQFSFGGNLSLGIIILGMISILIAIDRLTLT